MNDTVNEIIVDRGTIAVLRTSGIAFLFIVICVFSFLLYQASRSLHLAIGYRVLIFIGFYFLCYLYCKSSISRIAKTQNGILTITKGIGISKINTADIEKFKITHHTTSSLLTISIKLKNSFWKKHYRVYAYTTNVGGTKETKEKLEQMLSQKAEGKK